MTFLELAELVIKEENKPLTSNEIWNTARISEDEDFIKELERLYLSFGIGVIELNMEDPHSSDLRVPAKYKKVLDFETINKLAMNNDFKEFLETVQIDYTSGKIYNKEYDKVFEIEELVENKIHK